MPSSLSTSWVVFVVVIALSVVVRSGVLAATLAAAAGSFEGFVALWVLLKYRFTE